MSANHDGRCPRHRDGKHVPTKQGTTLRPWFGCATGAADCDDRAHGGVTRAQRCTCGATRTTESNGRFTRKGAWRASEGR